MSKKILRIFLVGISLFVLSGKVEARTITVSELSETFNQSEMIKIFNEIGLKISSKVNQEDLDIYNDGKKVATFKHGDNYLELDNKNVILSENSSEDDQLNEIVKSVAIGGIVESLFKIQNHDNKTIQDADYSGTFELYGLQYEEQTITYEVKENSDGTNVDVEISLTYPKYFKISLDSDKIDALYTKYGTDINYDNLKEETTDNLNKIDKSNNNTSKKKTKTKLTNPKTGLPFPTIAITISLISCGIVLLSIHKLKKSN